MEKLNFTDDNGESVEFYVIEETRVSGVNYLLVAETEEDEAQAYILKDVSDAGESEACYAFVEDEGEMEAVSGIFQELLDESGYIVE